MIAARLVLAVALIFIGASRVEAACTLSATGVAFGTYNVFLTTPDDSTGTITFRCGAQDRDITITISRGSSSAFSPRTLRSGVDILNYNLYRNAGFTEIWGDASEGTFTYFIRNPPNNQDIVLTVYGRVPPEQDARIGTYSDTVVVTIEY